MPDSFEITAHETNVVFRGERWCRVERQQKEKYDVTICWMEVGGEQKFTYDEDGGDGWMYRRYASYYPECCEVPLIEKLYQEMTK